MSRQVIPQFPAEAGIVQTVGLLRALVNQSIHHPLIQLQARAAIGSRAVTAERAAALLGQWTRAMMVYTPDADELEEITAPGLLAQRIAAGERPGGDCDDMVGYTAALAKALGFPVTFEVVGQSDRFHHIFLTIGGYRVDPTVPAWKPPFPAQRHMRVVV